MRHIIRIKRHVIRDLLAFGAGGALVAAITQRSWMSLAIAVFNGIILFLEEEVDIDEEETE